MEINRRRALALVFLRLIDVGLILFSATVAARMRFGEWLPPVETYFLIFFAPVIYLASMKILDGYRYFRPHRSKIGFTKLSLALGLAFGFLLIGTYFSKSSSEFSRLWVGYWVVLAPVLVVVGRLLLTALLSQLTTASLLVPQVLVFAGEGAESIVHELMSRSQDFDFGICGIYYIPSCSTVPIEGAYPTDMNLTALINHIRTSPVDYVVLALSESEHRRLEGSLENLQEFPINLLKAPIDRKLSTCHQEQVSEWVIFSDLPFQRLLTRPLNYYGWLLKGIEDYVIGTLCLLILSPIMALIAITIKCSSRGPVLFKQLRRGFNGNDILVYKFRTMIDDHSNELGVRQATKYDPRVTRVGRVLRKTSMDELPQLINVLKGDMSLVGPRPHALEHNLEFARKVDKYLVRNRVKPGITGWAQVNGWRGETDTDEKIRERVRHDIFYINNWSLVFDMRILVMTFFAIFSQKNAY